MNTQYTMFRCFLAAALLLIGCGEVTSNGTPEIDAGTGGAMVGDSGPGGTGGGGWMSTGTGGATHADGGGTGGVAMPGTGGTGTGGAIGSGGGQGSGGAVASGGAMGTGGTTSAETCVDPMGWKIKGGLSCDKAKGGRECVTNCTSTQPGGLDGNYIGPPMHAECWFGNFVCVASCSECS